MVEHDHDHCEHDHCEAECRGGACCGCDHEEMNERTEWLKEGAALLLFVASFFVTASPFREILLIGSALVCGLDLILTGIKGLFKLKINENLLVAIAVAAAFVLGDFSEAALVVMLFKLGLILEHRAEEKTQNSIRSLMDIKPETAILLEDGREGEVRSEHVPIGSVIIVRPGARIPIDGEVVEGSSTTDNSALTGESLPVEVAAGDRVQSGCINGSGLIKLRTTALSGDSAASRIIEMVESSQENRAESQKFITRFAAIYTPIVIGIAILVAAVPPLFFGGAVEEWLYRAMVLLVASCPCAVVIAVPLSFVAAIGASTKAGLVLKGGKYVEALSRVRHFAFDKTGTITDGQLAVSEVFSFGDVDGDEVLRLTASLEKYSSHPIGAAILAYYGDGPLAEMGDCTEEASVGVFGTLLGVRYGAVSPRYMMGLPGDKSELPDATVYLLRGGVPIGAIGLSDSVKVSAAAALKELHAMGKSVTILTGDRPSAAVAVAEAVGADKCFSSLKPEDKVEKVKELMADGGTAFVGDGINDAPVLSLADVGLSMGFGSDAAIEVSDGVLMNSELSALPKAVKIAKSAMNTIYFNVVFALAIKLAVVVASIIGYAPMWMAVFADVGVSFLAILNALRLYRAK